MAGLKAHLALSIHLKEPRLCVDEMLGWQQESQVCVWGAASAWASVWGDEHLRGW